MKKILSILLVAVMLFTMVPASVFAAEAPSVKLVSFMRGDVTDLRSSELLEVQVEGYDGNPRELTYKWTSSLGTYLYIYNSHNMYGINNTYGEYEIYNTDKNIKRNSNVEEDRSGNKTLSKVGFMWASVYGAYTYNGGSASSALKGTVKVEVFDKNKNKIGEDSFSSFKGHNLDSDLDNVVIGLFEGDRKNVLDLLGESGIVHITCSESSVSSAKILEGGEHIGIETEKMDKNTYNYYIKGVKAGDNSIDADAQLEINIKKSACKFHYNTSGSAKPLVYVFKKPTTTTTTTTLIINKYSVDDRCEYFIDGNKGEKQPDGTVIFTGLTPNTDYTVEVRAEYDDNGTTKYVYSYVDDTTKPVYSAKIYTYLDGALTDFENIYGSGAELFIRENNAYADYISLEKKSTGIYEAPLYNAVFYAWHKINDTYNKASDYELIIENANAELHLHNYSVKYDTNGGKFKTGEEVDTEVYASMSAVNATSNVPVRDGYIFTGWEYDGKTIASGKQVTASITSPVTLKAKWEKAVNVTINVTIDHNSEDGGYDQVATRADLDIDFLEMTADSPAFVETGDKLYFRQDKVTDENGNAKDYTYSVENNKSTYTATDYTYTGLLESSSFGVALSKSDYDVGAIEKIEDENGNWIINVPLEYNPSNFDIKFSLEMAEGTPPELYPDAAIVKVAFWNGTEWEIITQQASTDSVVKPGVRVDIDPETGKGAGSYPVWKYADDNVPYGNRIVVTGFVYGDSIITVPAESINGKIATYTDGYYTATMTDVADGQKYGELYGAYYDKNTDAQVGTLHGVISVEKYDVIFDANGGKINGGNTYTETDEYYVPDTDNYVPTFDEHTFMGWYKDPEFKEPAVSGELLTENITFYAKWDQILTGYVRVAGSYMQDGKIVDVWAVDRAKTAVVVLQEIVGNEVYNVDRQTVKIVWPMAEMVYGISDNYKFEGLDPAKEYRVDVLVLNYGTTYQNSTTEYVIDENYADDYNDKDYTAVYPETSKWETFVNAYLSFEPASYFQPVVVDATLIGENLRPENTLVQVWYKATGTDNAFQVISQHTVVPYGIEIGMGADGMDNGDYGYTVWNSVYDGSLYDYQAYLKEINGAEVSTWPVSVVYGAPSRYNPINNAPTGTLQVKLIPNTYNIIYNENYVNEDVNVVSYGSHTWSYETLINYVPLRDGYVFDGWYSDPECEGNKVTKLDATVAEDTNLYAKWEKRADLELTVNYVDKADNSVLETETKTAQVFGNVISAESLKKDFTGYTFDSASAESVTIGTGTNEITLYYTKRADLELRVNYVDKTNNKVFATETFTGQVFGDVISAESLRKEFTGYTYDSVSAQSVTIGAGVNEITFYYTKRADLQLKVNYVDKTDNKVLATETKEGQVFGSVVSAESLKKDFTGYKFDSASVESVTIGLGKNEITLYYTKRADLQLKVNYVDIITNKALATETKTALVYGDVFTAESLKKNFTGYTFVNASAESVTIGTGTNEITLYYTNYYDYSVNYLDENGKVIADGKNGEAVYGTTITESPIAIKNYTPISNSSQTITIIDGKNFINFYYATDKTGGGTDGNTSDGIPDKYQKKVIFKVVNGKWADGKTADKVVYLTLMKNGEYAVDGKATLTAPTGMKANDGFEGGKWDATPPASVSGTKTETFTFRFTEIVPEIPEGDGEGDGEGEGNGSGDGNGSASGGAEHIVFGKTDGIGWYKVSKDGGQTYDIVFGNSTYEVKHGTEIIVSVGDIMGDSFVFYVNGVKHYPDENGNLVITVNGYMLIGALSVVPEIDFEVPDTEESLNWFQKIIKAIKDFFAKLFGKK